MKNNHTIKKGKHNTSSLWKNIITYIPYKDKSKSKTNTYIFKFDSSVEYCKNDELGVDCNDWNKLLGRSYFPLWNAQKNSEMLAFRHTSSKGVEVTPYLHDKTGERHYAEYHPFKIKINTYYKAVLKNDTIRIYELKNVLETPNGIEYDSFLNTKEKIVSIIWYIRDINIKRTKWRRQINSWFGGNRKASQDINYFLIKV